MKTEFLIPFEIDTSVVEAKIESDGYDVVIQRLTGYAKHRMEASLPKNLSGGDWRAFVQQLTEKFVEDHADEIVDIAAELLARKAGNKKRWREVLDEIKRERKED